MSTTYTDLKGETHTLNDCEIHHEPPFVQVVKSVQWGPQYLVHCKSCARTCVPRTGNNMKLAAADWNKDNP